MLAMAPAASFSPGHSCGSSSLPKPHGPSSPHSNSESFGSLVLERLEGADRGSPGPWEAEPVPEDLAEEGEPKVKGSPAPVSLHPAGGGHAGLLGGSQTTGPSTSQLLAAVELRSLGRNMRCAQNPEEQLRMSDGCWALERKSTLPLFKDT